MQHLRLVLMGSPAIAIPGFRALFEAGHHIAAVFTQPDKIFGRKRELKACPVAAWARQMELRVEQPATFRKKEPRQILGDLAPDAFVVTAYGRILPRSVLAIPRLGAVNLHASLLPRWRGASPIQAAIQAGDSETGLTTMLMDVGLDTGPMLLVERIPILPTEDSPSLSQKMADISGDLLLRTLDGLAEGSIEPIQQPQEGITFAPILGREHGALSWTDQALHIERSMRAFRPWPGITLPIEGGRLKILDAQLSSGDPNKAPGQVLRADGKELIVNCTQGALDLLRVQAPGKKAMQAIDWARGARLDTDFRFPC